MPKASRLQVIQTGSRRRLMLEEKRRIVAESDSGARRVSATARRYGLSTRSVLHLATAGKARLGWSCSFPMHLALQHTQEDRTLRDRVYRHLSERLKNDRAWPPSASQSLWMCYHFFRSVPIRSADPKGSSLKSVSNNKQSQHQWLQ
jgi:transposase-like protein